MQYEQHSTHSFRGGFSVEYKSDGRLLMLVDSGRALYGRSSPAGARQARRTVDQRLSSRILAWALRVTADEPIYALAVVYSSDAPYTPVPYLAIATERERIARTGGDRRDALWNPAEWDVFEYDPREVCDDEELAAACQTLEQEWRATDREEAVLRLFRRCVAELRENEALRARFAHGDVVVYAVDSELVGLEASLKRACPGTVRRRLEAASR